MVVSLFAPQEHIPSLSECHSRGWVDSTDAFQYTYLTATFVNALVEVTEHVKFGILTTVTLLASHHLTSYLYPLVYSN